MSKKDFCEDDMHVVKLILVALAMHKVEDKSDFAAIMGTTIKAWCDIHKMDATTFLTAMTMSIMDAEKELGDSEADPPFGIFNID